MLRQKEKQTMSKQQQKKKKEQEKQKEDEKMSSPFLILQEDKEKEMEVEDNDTDVSNINLDNDKHVEHCNDNEDVEDDDGDEIENKKSRNLKLQTWKSLLLAKRQENEKLTTICNELNARRDHLIDQKLQLLVSMITTQTPNSDDQEHNYLHWLNVENKKCIEFIRQQIQSDKLKANAYLEQYDEYQNKLRESILQKELFDEYTMMSYNEIADAKDTLTSSTKNLQEQIEGNKLKGEEITKKAEEDYKNFIEEISTLESYENEIINLKKQLKFEAQKPNFIKKRLLN